LGISHGDRVGRTCVHAGRIGSVADAARCVCPCVHFFGIPTLVLELDSLFLDEEQTRQIQRMNYILSSVASQDVVF